MIKARYMIYAFLILSGTLMSGCGAKNSASPESPEEVKVFAQNLCNALLSADEETYVRLHGEESRREGPRPRPC